MTIYRFSNECTNIQTACIMSWKEKEIFAVVVERTVEITCNVFRSAFVYLSFISSKL